MEVNILFNSWYNPYDIEALAIYSLYPSSNPTISLNPLVDFVLLS